jgi:hypothetical protein
MAFGLVFLDNDGAVWTVDVRQAGAEHSARLLLFSRPSFLDPAEQLALDDVPACWPNCNGDDLRGLLAAARHSRS